MAGRPGGTIETDQPSLRDGHGQAYHPDPSDKSLGH